MSLFHFIMNFYVKYRSFNLITLGREWGGGELEVSFSLIPLKLFMKRFWQSVRETQCLSKAHLSLPSQTFYKRAERTRGSTVRSQKGSLRDLHIILLCSFIRSKTLGLKLKTLSVFWICNCDDSDCYKFFI